MIRPSVVLIGAGPGDPGLITARGLEILRAADVVVYDELVPRRLLEEARPHAERIAVGSASPTAAEQEAINYLLAEKVREGRLVARLKWGDPFVFDRGGEEALFLHEQRVPFEIVPGVPVGVAAPAYAGVPVTYPGEANTVTFVRGYEDQSRTPPDVDWKALAALGGTIVCYAGPQQLLLVIDELLASGFPPALPAVAVYNGTRPDQETLAGTLDSLAAQIRQRTRREAATLVVGRVAGFRDHLRWFDARPLSGRRVLVTRPRDQAAELVDRLDALGAEAVVVPLVRIEPPEDAAPLRDAVSRADAFDWIVFASANAVDAFIGALFDSGRDVRSLKGPRLCCVGTATAARLSRAGIRVDLVPEPFTGDAVAGAIEAASPLAGLRVLLPRADIGREVIASTLKARGALVTEVVAYRTVLVEPQPGEEPDVYRLLLDGRIDVVTFTSGSAVRNFARIYGTEQAADLLRPTVVAVIGPTTAAAAAELGIRVTVQPSSYTTAALVDAIAAHFAR